MPAILAQTPIHRENDIGRARFSAMEQLAYVSTGFSKISFSKLSHPSYQAYPGSMDWLQSLGQGYNATVT